MKSLTTFILTIIGFLFISALPALIFETEKLGSFVLPYFETIYQNLMKLFQPEQWVYFGSQKTYPLFPMLWDRYFYSMTIFAISLLIAVILSHFFMILFQVVPRKIKKILLAFSSLMGSLPDAFIIISLQLLVIMVYKKTNILVAQIAVFEEDIYLLPIICLSVIPTFLLFKAILFLLKEEESKLYIDLAKMKGLTSLRICSYIPSVMCYIAYSTVQKSSFPSCSQTCSLLR
jgi:peptide/nickel transport system permease protein